MLWFQVSRSEVAVQGKLIYISFHFCALRFMSNVTLKWKKNHIYTFYLNSIIRRNTMINNESLFVDWSLWRSYCIGLLKNEIIEQCVWTLLKSVDMEGCKRELCFTQPSPQFRWPAMSNRDSARKVLLFRRIGSLAWLQLPWVMVLLVYLITLC